MTQIDWRLKENRREAFQRFYSFHLQYKTHPGCVYFALPAIAEAYDLDHSQKAWLTWLNGNTQNPAMSLLLLQEAPNSWEWRKAVDFWNDNFRKMDWDTDRRHQKSKFGVATESWFTTYGMAAEQGWFIAGQKGWDDTWGFAKGQPYMGRLSAWSMIEYARILFGSIVPDAGSWLLQDVSGSRSHRNGIAVVKGYDAWSWDAEAPSLLGIVEELEEYADDLLTEARVRNGDMGWKHPDVGRLTMESALCTYKSWHKPNRRYPNVYSDMMYGRLKKAEARFGDRFQILWDARSKALPIELRLEDNPLDPGVAPIKQNWYRETGEILMMDSMFPDMSSFNFHDYVTYNLDERKDPKWTS